MPLIIYKSNISYSKCQLKLDSDKLTEIEAYTIDTINSSLNYINNDELNTHKLTIDYMDDIEIGMICSIGSNYFKINSIDNINFTNTTLIIYLEELTQINDKII